MACSESSSAASSVQEQKYTGYFDVMFICDEWGSSRGGMSTFNREFAINLAKATTNNMKIHCYVSKSDERDREDARQHGVNLITARSVPGSADSLDWLKIPPPELPHPDVVVGHGRKFGTPAYFIVQATKCKWVQFVHVFCEDLGKYKKTAAATTDTIEENEKKHKREIELCRAADAVVAVGSRLQQKYSRSLPDIKVEIITPGILEKFSSQSQLAIDRSVVKKFNVFMFGRATFEDLTLKGYDIVANVIGSLGKEFELTFVGSSTGEHQKVEQWFLDKTCINQNQLTIRGYINKHDDLKMMFHESDLVALPSRTEGFGLVALEAISTGIPVLVADESGIAEALQEVKGGKSVIVETKDDSEEEWAQRIKELFRQSPKQRQNNARQLRDNYRKVYSWKKECERFWKVIQSVVESTNVYTGSRHFHSPDVEVISDEVEQSTALVEHTYTKLGPSYETQYRYIDDTERDRRKAKGSEARRLENERKMYEIEEKLRIEREKQQEEQRRREQLRQQRQKEIEEEVDRRRAEEQERLELEAELCRRRDQLFNYKFGDKTSLDNFLGLQIDDVTQLRIGVFGAAGSGKTSFINTCERAVRQTEQGSTPGSSAPWEDTITLQDYLPEMFFHLVDTRCFFNYNSEENIEFQNILYGKLQPGDTLVRSAGGQNITQEMHRCPAFGQRLHGIIIVVKANDPRLTEGAMKDDLKPVRHFLGKNGIAPITVITHRDKLKFDDECNEAFDDASAATESSPSHTFFMWNYTIDNKERNPEIELMTFDILNCVLTTAERAVKIMKQQEKNKQEDEMMKALEGVNICGQVALDSADASVEVFLRFLQKDCQWSTNSVKTVLSELAKDDITTVRLLAMCWSDVRQRFPAGMSRMIEKELKKRDMIMIP